MLEIFIPICYNNFMSVILVPMGPQYIKKEDALDFFKNYLRGQIIIGFSYTIISFFLILFFLEK
jgi:hypothetical protein